MDFKIEHLDKYLSEAEDDYEGTEEIKDEDIDSIDKNIESGGHGFEMEPVERDDFEGEVESYDIVSDGKPVCSIEIINDSNEEIADFEEAQSEPAKYTIYISKVMDAILTDEYKNKLDTMGFERIIDKDEDKVEEVPAEVEEEGMSY